MNEGLDAALNTEATRVSGALSGCSCLVAALIVQAEAELLHLVLVALSVVACDAKVVIL